MLFWLKEKPEKGKVVAVGPGRLQESGQRTPISVKVGDKVMFKKYSPDEIKVEGEDYLVIQEGDIIAVINSNNQESSGNGGFQNMEEVDYS